MTRVAAIGAESAMGGFALAGVTVLAAERAEQVRAAWRALPPDVGLVLLTGRAAAALSAELAVPSDRLTVVSPG